jgi:SAM-dependent methyltransferase
MNAFRARLERIPPDERDAWVDRELGLVAVPDDGPELPRGCVPYLPCPVSALLHVIDRAEVCASDVIVDIGSGAGRAAIVMHLATGASAIGIEIQQHLAAASRALAARCDVTRFSVIEGDAAVRVREASAGTVFFLYCPFSGERLERVLDALSEIAQKRPIRVCTVGLHVPARPWLREIGPPVDDVVVHRSVDLRDRAQP